jgi:hypothetical protein
VVDHSLDVRDGADSLGLGRMAEVCSVAGNDPLYGEDVILSYTAGLLTHAMRERTTQRNV